MKEIDFIPSWYHEQRRRKRWYRNRCIVILAITLCWMLGNLLSGRVISNAHAELDSLKLAYEQGLRKIELSRHLEQELDMLINQERVLNQLCPRTKLSVVVAELTHRIGDGIILSGIHIDQAVIEPEKTSEKTDSTAAVVLGPPSSQSESSISDEPTCWNIIISGIAVDAAEVAGLIHRLEESEFFTDVVPRFSRNKQMEKLNVSEFEIICKVADFVRID